MWLLKDAKGNVKYLKPSKIIKIGRKDADIVLENDTSISRAHATITVTLKEQVQPSEESSVCSIKDNNSKYGSFVVRNGIKLKISKEDFELHHGDAVTFGLQNHTYSVEYLHFVTVVTRLNADHKQKLKDAMDVIGGIIIDFYNNHCTHVTASTAATTTKIIFGLISGIPIVGIDYWMQVKKCTEENKPLPDPNLFSLSLQDAGINLHKVSLKPNPLRKTLFQNKTFIFFCEKSFKEYKQMIQRAGGTVEVHPICSSIPDDLFLDNYIVMKTITNENSTEELIAFDTLLQNKMKEKNLRAVNETEIPLAIIYANLNQYCNPKYDFTKLLKRKAHKEDKSEVLALDTQDIIGDGLSKNIKSSSLVSKSRFIPESVDFEDPQSVECDNEKEITKINETHSKNNFKQVGNLQIQRENEASNKNHPHDAMTMKTSSRNLLKPIDSKSFKKDKEAISPLLSNTEDDLYKSKESKRNKRERETSDCDEIHENIQRTWMNKKGSPKESQIKNVSVDTKNDDDFQEVKSKKAKINDNKKIKADEFGFKKSNKKVIDFDLDDIDINESKKTINKIKIDVTDSSNREYSKSEPVSIKKKPKTIVEPEVETEMEQKVQLKAVKVQDERAHTENWFDHPVKEDIDQVNIGISQSSLVSIKREIDIDHPRCSKAFKKVYDQIPATRVPLKQMTIWTPQHTTN